MSRRFFPFRRPSTSYGRRTSTVPKHNDSTVGHRKQSLYWSGPPVATDTAPRARAYTMIGSVTVLTRTARRTSLTRQKHQKQQKTNPVNLSRPILVFARPTGKPLCSRATGPRRSGHWRVCRLKGSTSRARPTTAVTNNNPSPLLRARFCRRHDRAKKAAG